MSTCQVEYVRKVAGTESGHAVELMPPPSYLQALLYEGNRKPIPGVSSDIILVYKSRVKSSTSSLPIDVPDEINDSLDTSADLIGDPLPAPFDENDELQVSFHERKEYLWPKGELNHYPLQKQEALNILDQCDETSSKFDVWCLVDGGVSNKPVEMNESLNGFSNGNHSADASILDSTITDGFNSTKYSKMSRILLGVHATGEWWTSSYVTSQGLCSASSREMDPEFMITAHHDILPSHKMNVSVLCRYNIAGERLTSSVPSSATSACCVSLELKWRTPTLNVPSEDVFADVVVQASVGHESSPAHGLWKQLCILQKLFEVLCTCWDGGKTTPEVLPHLEPALNGSIDCEIPQEPLQSRIQTLILGGKQALQAQTAYRMSIVPSLLARQSLAPGRLSVAPSLLGRQSTAPGFLDRMSPAQQEEIVEDGVSCSIIEALELAAAGNREDSDITDGIFSLLIECTTYPELVSAWELIFMELHNAHRAPFVRPRNSTRAAKLIQGFEPGQSGELKGTLLGLELLFELGLEKLTTDYNYVFLKSLLVARGELQAPQLIRSNIGVPKEKWHDSCGKLLGWLAQVHCALEMALPLENPMNYIAKCMASKALKHFTSENSPVRSVESLLTPGNSIQEFSLPVPSKVVHEHAHRNFDWWRMSVTSETSARRVKSVFLRSRLHPIFPPQLCDDSDTLITTEGSVHFYCAEAVTESQKL